MVKTARSQTRRQGTVYLNNSGSTLLFLPDVYPVAQITRDGWRQKGDTWLAPFSAQRVLALRQQFPRIDLEPRLAAHLERTIERGLAHPMPHTFSALFPYQQRAATWLAGRNSAALYVSPGLGKSCIALTALQMHEVLSATVVCPLTLLRTWEREAHRWWPEAAVHLQPDDVHLTPNRPDLIVLTYDRFRLRGLPIRTHTLIFDESVLLKNRKALRTKAATAARKQATTCWLLSGSPVTRFIDDLWAQLHVLEPREWPSYWRFVERFCIQRQTIWGTEIVANAPTAEERLRGATLGLTYHYGYADLAQEEPAKAIPEWTFETREVPLPDSWWKSYRQMQQQFLADLPDGSQVVAANTLARMIRLQQLASGPGTLTDEPGEHTMLGGKNRALLGVLEELPQPTIIWTAFKRTAEFLSLFLKAPLLTGATPADERQRIVDGVQAGETPYLVAHPGVGRFGLTLTAAKSAIYVERSYDGDHYYQSLYRIRRIGTTEPPRVVHMLATGPDGERTIDHVIDRVLGFRAEQAQQITTAILREVLA